MSSSPNKAAHIGLWVAQGLLAFAFGAAGAMKATAPLDQLAQNLPWVAESPAALVRFIGVSEFLGALGLILPSALRILPKLTPLAAAGLATIMVLAAGHHLRAGDPPATLVANAVLGGIAVAIAYGRTRVAPISAR